MESVFPQVQAGHGFVMVLEIQLNGNLEEPIEEQMEEPEDTEMPAETEEPNQPEEQEGPKLPEELETPTGQVSDNTFDA